jgi:hypothetical protein
VYPGESQNRFGQVVGHIYVNDGAEAFDVAGGPPTSRPDVGGHTATRTPAGRYSLDRAEHHTTQGWPKSVVPWGAQLREEREIVQYNINGRWLDASGPKGSVTRAFLMFSAKSRQPMSPLVASRFARQIFYDTNGVLMSVWQGNDFGKWSWNLKMGRHRTVFFIHTTPQDEAAVSSDFDLLQSHGCLHIRPRDRDTMVAKGYLQEGITVIVKRYEDRWRR